MIDKQGIILKNDDMLVRPVQVSDITDEYIDGLNDPDVNRYLVAVRQQHQTRESVTQYVKADWDNPLSILFGIFTRNDDGPLVGTVRVHNIDLFHFLASAGVCLFAKRAWKRGYAHRALRMVKDWLFADGELHYLEAGVYAENVDSLNCFLRAGFAERYRVSGKFRHIDSFADVIFLAAINDVFDLNPLKVESRHRPLMRK
jgi:RimJ/RimL family protein N-acetyltransferase